MVKIILNTNLFANEQVTIFQRTLLRHWPLRSIPVPVPLQSGYLLQALQEVAQL